MKRIKPTEHTFEDMCDDKMTDSISRVAIRKWEYEMNVLLVPCRYIFMDDCWSYDYGVLEQ